MKHYLAYAVIGIVIAIGANILVAHHEVQPEDYGFIQDVKCGTEWYGFYVTEFVENSKVLCDRYEDQYSKDH